MNDFDEIRNHWNQRQIPPTPPHGYEEVIEKEDYVHKKQTLTQGVLSVTLLVLTGFFFYISAYQNNHLLVGLLLMMGSLILRIFIEFLFKMKKNNYRLDQDMIQYNCQLVRYLKARKYIHYLVTPALFIAYIVGFLMLLPGFKENLSSGFYSYIVYSSWIIFAALAVLIIVQVRKELEILRELTDS